MKVEEKLRLSFLGRYCRKETQVLSYLIFIREETRRQASVLKKVSL